MHKKNWTDQPDEVTRAEPICSMFLKMPGISVEVRRIDYETAYFLTTGNLFGSQTIKAPDANTVFRILDKIAHMSNGATLEIEKFPGVEIMEPVA